MEVGVVVAVVVGMERLKWLLRELRVSITTPHHSTMTAIVVAPQTMERAQTYQCSEASMRGTTQTMAPSWIGVAGVDVADSRFRERWMVVWLRE